jgi:hypothetical protein
MPGRIDLPRLPTDRVPDRELAYHKAWCHVHDRGHLGPCNCGVQVPPPPPPRVDEHTRFARAHLVDGGCLDGPLCLVRQVGELAYAPMTYVSTADGSVLVPISAVLRLVREVPTS